MTWAQRLVVTRANITGVLRRLQERDLVATCEHAQDGRSFVCALTKTGRSLTRRARAAAAHFVRAQLKPFGDVELAQVERLISDVYTDLQTLDPAVVGAMRTEV